MIGVSGPVRSVIHSMSSQVGRGSRLHDFDALDLTNPITSDSVAGLTDYRWVCFQLHTVVDFTCGEILHLKVVIFSRKKTENPLSIC